MNKQILAAVEDTLRRAKVFTADATLLVALSGGPDSVALLWALCALRADAGFQVRAAHVEHGLRGAASLADARFCERLCGALAVPFTCDYAGLGGDMHTPGAETRARDARYALLLQRAHACHADALLLAHHLDDQAETVLAHLLRGSGARGLGGMRPISVREGVTVLRPLLSLPKQTLIDALQESPCPGAPDDVPYRMDETNVTACCQRNRLRLTVLPLLTRENPRAAEHIAQSAALLALDEDCLQTQADALVADALVARAPLFCLRKAPLLAAPPAVAVRALRRFVSEGWALMATGTGAALPAPAPPTRCVTTAADAFSSLPEVSGGGAALNPEGAVFGEGERNLNAQDSMALLMLLTAAPGSTLGLPQGVRAYVGQTCLHLTRMEGDGAPLRLARPPASLPLNTMGGEAVFNGFRFGLCPWNRSCDAVPDGVTCVALPADRLRQCVLRVPEPGDRIHPFGAPGSKPFRRYLTDRQVDLPFRSVLPVLCDGQDVLWAVGVGAAEGTRLPREPETPCVRLCVHDAPLWANAPVAGG